MIAVQAQTELQTAKTVEALEAAAIAEEAKARLEEENAQLRERYEALRTHMQHEEEARESMTGIAERVNQALSRLDAYDSALTHTHLAAETLEVVEESLNKIRPASNLLRNAEAAQPPRSPNSWHAMAPTTVLPSLPNLETAAVEPYLGPLHGLYVMEMPKHHSSPMAPPFSKHLASDALQISEDAYTARRRTYGCDQAVAIGSAALECQAGGLYFEVQVAGTMGCSTGGGLAIGVTHTAPTSFRNELPLRAEDIPMTVAVGYSGVVYLNGCERQTNWKPENLQCGQRVGVLITDDGRGDLVVFEDQEPVVCIDGFALREAGLMGEPLYPIVEIFGTACGLTMVPLPSMPTHSLERLRAAELIPAMRVHDAPATDLLKESLLPKVQANDTVQSTKGGTKTKSGTAH
jgi:hypothetical protein